MHTYRNQYRVANRSFGEIVTLTVGSVDNLMITLDTPIL